MSQPHPAVRAIPLLSLAAASSVKQQVWVVVVNVWTTGAGSAPGAGADASQGSFRVMLSPARPLVVNASRTGRDWVSPVVWSHG